jgi:hypothetical protein
MAIADLAAKASTDGVPWRTCKVCHALATIPDGEAAGLRALLANPKKRYDEISSEIAADEDTPLQIDRDALSRHARGKCAAREKLR